LCPFEQRPFRIYDIEHGPERATFALDVCTTCKWFWFDHGELERLPLARKPRSRTF
jgi:Zn-finger nucleic acid-binding protein